MEDFEMQLPKMMIGKQVYLYPKYTIYNQLLYVCGPKGIQVFVGKKQIAFQQYPIITMINGVKFSTVGEVDYVNEKYCTQRGIGVIDSQLIFVNGIDVYKVKFDQITNDIEMIHIQHGSFNLSFCMNQYLLLDLSKKEISKYKIQYEFDMKKIPYFVYQIMQNSDLFAMMLNKQKQLLDNPMSLKDNQSQDSKKQII